MVTWCSSAVNCAFLSRRAACRTRSSACDTPGPALCPGCGLLAAFPSVSPLSSPTSAAAALLGLALFGGFAGTTGPSDCPYPFIPGLPPQRSLNGPPPDPAPGRTRALPVVAHEGSVHALVL